MVLDDRQRNLGLRSVWRHVERKHGCIRIHCSDKAEEQRHDVTDASSGTMSATWQGQGAAGGEYFRSPVPGDGATARENKAQNKRTPLKEQDRAIVCANIDEDPPGRTENKSTT